MRDCILLSRIHYVARSGRVVLAYRAAVQENSPASCLKVYVRSSRFINRHRRRSSLEHAVPVCISPHITFIFRAIVSLGAKSPQDFKLANGVL